MLTREELLSGKSLRTETVEISLGEVRIREMRGNEREEFSNCFVGTTAIIPPGMQARMIRWCVIDPPMADASDDDIYDKIGGKDLEKMCTAIMRLSGLTEEGIEDLSGNSESDRKDAPGSGSQKLSVAQ